MALAAVRRWGRPVADLERAVALASRVETDRLKRNVGTLRRIAAMSPLLGLLGTLIAAGRTLSVPGAAWGPALGNSLIQLTSGVALAIVALVAYDGLVGGRVERLANAIDLAWGASRPSTPIAMLVAVPEATTASRPVRSRVEGRISRSGARTRSASRSPTPSRGTWTGTTTGLTI